ncbi:hypothetical protein [Haladaptatus sp. GCM10025893]|uniref:hypothetical protein n=2 Tax=Haladaptatus TaxID=367188 RepID=UPI003619F8E5
MTDQRRPSTEHMARDTADDAVSESDGEGSSLPNGSNKVRSMMQSVLEKLGHETNRNRESGDER